MKQDIRNLKQKCNATMIAHSPYVVTKFGEVGSTNGLVLPVVPHP